MRPEQRYGVQDFWGRMGWCPAPVPRSIFAAKKIFEAGGFCTQLVRLGSFI